MREIKFRAWSPEHKIMLPHEFIDEETNLAMLNDEESDVVYMQYTGLCDRNGKEIYEGDMIDPDPGHAGELASLAAGQSHP